MSDRKTRILVVEDEYLSAQYFKAILEREGYEVIGTAATSQQAIDFVEKHEPEVICMDIGLGNSAAGIDLARRIQGFSAAAIIFVTGYQNNSTIRDRAMELKPRAYLVKPINVKDLVAAIEDVSGEEGNHGSRR